MGSVPDLRYAIAIYWSNEDEAYLVEVPQLPGCMADGDSYAEAVANAEDAMRAWIETARELGREVPVPAGHPLAP